MTVKYGLEDIHRLIVFDHWFGCSISQVYWDHQVKNVQIKVGVSDKDGKSVE